MAFVTTGNVAAIDSLAQAFAGSSAQTAIR
jgi:hypothetical protein